MSAVDNFLHQIKQAAQQQQDGAGPFVYGHIANYDPKLNRVRLILPSVRDENGNCVLTPWMQLGSAWAGNGFGFQVAPVGGATQEKPTAGEQCLVARIDRGQGFGAVLLMGFNQTSAPPVSDLQPGEAVLMAQGGSFVRFHADKHIEVNSQDKVDVVAVGDVSVTSQSKVALTAPAISLGSEGGAAQKLVTEAMVAFFNTHTHPGNGQPPSQTMGAAQLTGAVKGD